MGHKKGKQQGGFSSKSSRAAFLSQIQSDVQDTRLKLSLNKYHKQFVDERLNSNKGEYKSRINVGVLRGLLLERIIEDRSRDAMFRRATSRIHVSRFIEPSESTLCLPRSNEDASICSPGWLMWYNYREARAGIRATESKERIPSLQTLCLKSLAPYLKAYVRACGKEYIRDRLSVLTPHLLTKLSTLTLNVNDDLAFVLGCHFQLTGLVLNTKCRNVEQEDDDSYDCNQLGILGLQQLVRDLDHLSSFKNMVVLTEHWEDFHDYNVGIGNELFLNHPSTLERLELLNFHTHSLYDLVRILQLWKHLSHLSFSNCFNSVIGTKLLLGDEQNETWVLTNYIPNIKVLNFTGCSWLTFELLDKFISKIDISRNLSLEVICVQNCCDSISDFRLSCLNMQIQSRPYVTRNPYEIIST